MPRKRSLQPERGGKVQLTRDVRTRGGRVFRAGVVFRIQSVDGGIYLNVKVRGRHYGLTLQKKDYKRDCVVIFEPSSDDE